MSNRKRRRRRRRAAAQEANEQLNLETTSNEEAPTEQPVEVEESEGLLVKPKSRWRRKK